MRGKDDIDRKPAIDQRQVRLFQAGCQLVNSSCTERRVSVAARQQGNLARCAGRVGSFLFRFSSFVSKVIRPMPGRCVVPVAVENRRYC